MSCPAVAGAPRCESLLEGRVGSAGVSRGRASRGWRVVLLLLVLQGVGFEGSARAARGEANVTPPTLADDLLVVREGVRAELAAAAEAGDVDAHETLGLLMVQTAPDDVLASWMDGGTGSRERLWRLERLVLAGAFDEAAAMVLHLEGDDALLGQVLQAEALLSLGRSTEATAVLVGVRNGEPTGGRGHYAVARARVHLGEPGAARRSFVRALEEGGERLRTGVSWADLLVSEGRFAEASGLLRELLREAPWHPQIWLTSGRLALDAEGDAVRAGTAAEAAAALAGTGTGGRVILFRGWIALREGERSEAARVARLAVQSGAPVSSALRLEATAHALQGDDRRAEQAAQEAMDTAAAPAVVPRDLARLLDRRHRHGEALRWYLRAHEADPGSARGLFELALALSRLGKDDEAVAALRRVPERGGYVRAERSLRFHEEVLQQDYVDIQDTRRAGVTWRMHRDEVPVLLAHLVPVAHAALDRYEAHYGISTPVPLRIEVFREPESFGLRAFGQPEIAPHGYCFGPVVAMRSPSTGDFNWQHVLEHELSHVFTLSASGGHVPRWFTEGAAEWDVVRHWPAWRRRADLQVARALRSGALPSLRDLDEAFVHRPSIPVAYHLSFLWVEWLAERHGSDIVPRLTEAFGRERGHVGRVFEMELGVSTADLEMAFREALRERLAPLMRLYEPDPLHYGAPMEPRMGEPGEGALREFFLGRNSAPRTAQLALQQRPADPGAHWVLARLALLQGDDEAWVVHVEALEARGRRSATLWWAGGRAAEGAGRLEEARERLSRAVALAPELGEAWEMLGTVHERTGNEAAAREAYGRAAALDAGLWASRAWLHHDALARRDVEAASTRAEELLRIRPFVSLELRARLADSLLAGGRWEAAWRETLLELSTGSADLAASQARRRALAELCAACPEPGVVVSRPIRFGFQPAEEP